MTQLYLISPPTIELDAFAHQLDQVLNQNIASAFQLRLKDVTEESIVQACHRLVPICHEHGIPFIVNDSVELAKVCHADGVHMGEDDGQFAHARKVLGDDAIIGVSCYDSMDRAMALAEQGANYVSFGAFFPTTTKQAKAQPSSDILTAWSSFSTTPCVAIGGITAQNAPLLIEAGADMIAVISAIWSHPGGAVEGIKAFTGIVS